MSSSYLLTESRAVTSQFRVQPQSQHLDGSLWLAGGGPDVQFVCCSVPESCPTPCDPWTAARQASLSFTVSPSLLKLMSIESMMPSSHLILCHPLLLLPSIFPSIRVFSNESVLRIRWPEYWSFSFSISPSNEYSRLISFRNDSFDLFAFQGTLKSLLQHHSSKAFIGFFLAHLIFHVGILSWEPVELNVLPAKA